MSRGSKEEIFGERIFRGAVTFYKRPVTKFMGGYEEGKWYPYTPTFTGFGTPTNVSFSWRRSGGAIYIRGTFTSGTTTATEAKITLPLSLTSDSAVVTTIGLAGIFGTQDSGLAGGWYCLIESGAAYLTFSIEDATRGMLTKQNGNAIGGASKNMTLSTFPIPISGWN